MNLSRLTAEQQELVASCKEMPFYCCNKIYPYWCITKEMLETVAIEALIKAANHYDKTKEVKFSSYAYLLIMNSIRDYLKGHTKRITVSSETESIDTVRKSSELSYRDSGFDAIDDADEDKSFREKYNQAVDKMDKRNVAIMEECVLKGCTYPEVAKKYGISPQRVAILKEKTLSKLSNLLLL